MIDGVMTPRLRVASGYVIPICIIESLLRDKVATFGVRGFLTVLSPGKRRIERHRMIYAALGTLMQTDIHALKINAYTPAER